MLEAVQYQIAGKTAREIARSAEVAIREGDLGTGTRLPTVRSLARTLETSPATVNVVAPASATVSRWSRSVGVETDRGPGVRSTEWYVMTSAEPVTSAAAPMCAPIQLAQPGRGRRDALPGC